MAALANITPKTVLKGAGVAVAGSQGSLATAIASAHPDARLIALGNRYEAAFAYWHECYSAWMAAQDAFDASTPYSVMGQCNEYFAAWRDCGGDAVCKVSEDAWETLQWLQHEALNTPAQGATGLAVKGRVITLIAEADTLSGGCDCPEYAEWNATVLKAYSDEAQRLGLASLSQ